MALPYRLEHPHSAIIRNPQADGTRKQTLVAPEGSLHGVFRPTEDGFVTQSGYARRGTQLAALASHLNDLMAVAMPYEGLPCLLPTPYTRLRRDYLDPGLTDAPLEEGEGRKCRKLLESLYKQEIQLALRDRPQALVVDERLTASMLENPLWQRHAARAARVLTQLAPDTALYMTFSLAESRTDLALPSPWIGIYPVQEGDDQRLSALASCKIGILPK